MKSFKMGLKQKLIISYTLLACFLLLSVLIVSNYFLEKQFMVYMTHKQNMKNEEIVNLVLKNFAEDGSLPDSTFLKNLANNLLEQGIVLMLYGKDNSLKFCIHSPGEQEYTQMLESMAAVTKEKDPKFRGTYTEKRFDLLRNGVKLGSVWLGYYGPFYYSENDQNFLKDFNAVLYGISLFFFALSVAIGLFMANRIAEPIKKVTERTKRIAEGDYFERVNIVTNTIEMDALSSSVDHLAESLETQFLLKKRMASAYSHEFRTPLAILQSNVEAMIDGLWQPSKEHLEGLLSEILRLSRMVSEVDNLVQIRNQKGISDKVSSDISEITEHVLASFEANIKSKELHVHYKKEPCFACVDPDKFSQLVFNLISNAVKYTNQGGNIKIKTFNQENHAFFYIEDDGIGISNRDLPHIFEHMYRADESRARATGGNGIGLSVVKAILEAHGGTIQVNSKLGLGTTFIVSV